MNYINEFDKDIKSLLMRAADSVGDRRVELLSKALELAQDSARKLEAAAGLRNDAGRGDAGDGSATILRTALTWPEVKGNASAVMTIARTLRRFRGVQI
jgi:hypothetical protein